MMFMASTEWKAAVSLLISASVYLRVTFLAEVTKWMTLSSFSEPQKSKRGVRVDDYFPDIIQFVCKTRGFMSEGLFTNKVVYRLKKIVRKLTADNAN